NLKLTQLAKAKLSRKKMTNLQGGAGNCCCSCWAQNHGGSSTSANGGANDADDLTSIHGCIDEVVITA
ncbi:MAG: TIGR04149 family rSAM-modified RiPP, partial [Bacteroidales bacterium]|nr:TIGR04149 family rSAM-modified RiPP [Bacteroidales bacterium]